MSHSVVFKASVINVSRRSGTILLQHPTQVTSIYEVPRTLLKRFRLRLLTCFMVYEHNSGLYLAHIPRFSLSRAQFCEVCGASNQAVTFDDLSKFRLRKQLRNTTDADSLTEEVMLEIVTEFRIRHSFDNSHNAATIH